jgi:hypothetical protein
VFGGQRYSVEDHDDPTQTFQSNRAQATPIAKDLAGYGAVAAMAPVSLPPKELHTACYQGREIAEIAKKLHG